MVPWLSATGLAGLAATIAVGFEEPNVWMLIGSGLLLAAGPAALLAHLGLNPQLAPEEKRVWWHELTGPRAARAFAAYITSRDRRAVARRLAAIASGRRSGPACPSPRSP